jgi:hypothetical protein
LLKERDHVEDLGEGWMAILMWVLRIIGFEDVDFIYPAQDRDLSWTSVHMVMKLQVL